ncbi:MULTISPECIES: formate/nitrite transporter family protein [Halobacterium]|uniref:formate/nitrite transporter family protein n=1 Tax=Halobacterium TaxID=2239 RepID=UPI00073F4532|nr:MULTISPECIES: formate/nitrite transporter family protein [Halobacterium]MCG1003863.1 formate/nitrite transporter family protein [Halobacterium noricense]
MTDRDDSDAPSAPDARPPKREPGGGSTSADAPDPEESVREAIERSRSGAPAVGSVVRDRFTSNEIFQRIIAAADEEITSGSRELFFSALAAGFAITITFMLYVSLTATTGGDPVLSALLYPLGFIYIIIGGYQLYTENTLPPVALTLERLASIPALLRNWTVVLAGNFLGGALGAAALAFGGVISPEAAEVAMYLGQKGVATPWWDLFSKAAFAGLVVAGVVWVEYAARDTISRIVVVYVAFLAIPLGGLYHSVVSFTEMTYLVLRGSLSVTTGLWEFVLPVLLGNTVGGVLLVTVVNYFQTTEHRLASARFEGADRQLSVREWLFGGLVGRSYVPLIDHTEGALAEADEYRIVVPISNPRTETNLVELACTLASQKPGASVHVVHIVQMPDRTPGGYRVDQHERIVENSDDLMSDIRELAAGYDVPCETSTVVSHRSFEELFDAAKRKRADLMVMGWGDDRLWSNGRAERPLDELTNRLPSDVLVFRDRGLDASRILLPVVDNPHADLNAEVARTLRQTAGSEVTLLRVVDSPDDHEAGERFLADWAAEHDLEDATLRVDDSGDVESAIAGECGDHTLLLIGATSQGLLARLARNALHYDIVQDVETSMILAERATDRGLLQRLFGR